ncbi:MAG: hypothetical protein ACLP7O_00750, partial [Terracidiphilus sp.]
QKLRTPIPSRVRARLAGCSIFAMDIASKQSLAWARFQALQSHPPSSGDEGEVSQFHEIVSALEEAFNVDLSSFRVSDAEMKQRIVSPRRASYSGRFPARKQLSDKRFCNVHFLQRQIDGIAIYFQNLQPTPERQKIGF